MTKEEAAKWAELYKAYADGKIIQYKVGSNYEDRLVTYFDGDLACYRVKPEVKKSVGYRRYLYKHPVSSVVLVYLVYEVDEGTVDETEDLYGFSRWVDTEWQYAEYGDE